jgi:hypothetical protein
MSEKPSLEDLLNLLLNGNLKPDERQKVKAAMRKTSEFEKAKTIKIIIKERSSKSSSAEES